MKTLYVVHGLKRSGNHAIINWILSQKKMAFYNNIVPISPILSGLQSVPRQNNFDAWLKQKETSIFKKISVKLSRHVMVSLEDLTVDYQPFYDEGFHVVNVIIVRDPVNLFASRIRKSSQVELAAYPNRNDAIMQRAVSIWMSHAKEFTGESDKIQNKICIYFNRWYSSASYRKQICDRLDIVFTDKGYKQVCSKGGGSSFDKTKYDGSNERLNVLNRKDQLHEQEKKLLSEVLNNQEISRLAAAVEKAANADQAST